MTEEVAALRQEFNMSLSAEVIKFQEQLAEELFVLRTHVDQATASMLFSTALVTRCNEAESTGNADASAAIAPPSFAVDAPKALAAKALTVNGHASEGQASAAN